MDAVTKAQEMMLEPMGKLPTLAVEFAKYLCRKYGFCGETLMTAWAVYNQLAEGMTCGDSLYQPNDDAKKWFVERGFPIKPQPKE